MTSFKEDEHRSLDVLGLLRFFETRVHSRHICLDRIRAKSIHGADECVKVWDVS